MEVSWSDQRDEVAAALLAGGVVSYEIESRWIIEHVSGATPLEWPELQRTAVPLRLATKCDELVRRRVSGEPLQYALGEWSFRDFDLMVDSRVLIPRPETEWVVEVALAEAQRCGLRIGKSAYGRQAHEHVADMGTGSGAIAIALERALPDANVWACDRSAEALAVAAHNAMGNATHRVQTAMGDWFDALPEHLLGAFALIVSNPPYISEAEYVELAPEVRDHEPKSALVSGVSGLESIELLLRAAPRWLREHAAFVCEIAPHQRDDAIAIGDSTGAYREVFVIDDLTGRPRALVARRG